MKYVGIDLHKTTLTFCVVDDARTVIQSGAPIAAEQNPTIFRVSRSCKRRFWTSSPVKQAFKRRPRTFNRGLEHNSAPI